MTTSKIKTMKSSIFALLLFLAAAQFAMAQVNFSLSPEVGYSLTVHPRGNTVRNPNGYYKESLHNTFNPLLGLNARLLLGKHWLLSASLQYQLTGDAHHYHLNMRNAQGYIHLQDEYYAQRYHKICLPVMAGYSFPIGKVRPFLSIGYRAGYMVYGVLKSSSYYVNTQPGGYNRIFSHESHPLQIAHDPAYNWRWVGQVVCSVGAEMGAHLRVGINLASGNGHGYSQVEHAMEGIYRNNDLYFVAAWRIWERAGKGVPMK